jgi:chemotaxis protein MotB
MRASVVCLVLGAATAGCGVSEELYNARVNELNKVRADLDSERRNCDEQRRRCQGQVSELSQENDSLKNRLAALGQNVKDLANSKESLAADLDAARKTMEELRRQHELAEARARQFRELFGKFKAMVDAGKLKVEIRNGLMLVKLADNILFDPGKTALKPEGMEALREVSAILAGIQGRKFQVAGHTDNQPVHGHKFPSNWELSTARAVVVTHFMIDEGGMPGERLSAAGWADQMPVATNDTDEGRRQNRRIEIVLLPNIEDLPPLDDSAGSTATSSAATPAPASAAAPAPPPP